MRYKYLVKIKGKERFDYYFLFCMATNFKDAREIARNFLKKGEKILSSRRYKVK